MLSLPKHGAGFFSSLLIWNDLSIVVDGSQLHPPVSVAMRQKRGTVEARITDG